MVYDYGSDVVYEDNRVFYNGEPVGTAEQYTTQASNLAAAGQEVKPGENESAVFSRMPTPHHAKLDMSKLRKPQGPRSGIAAIMGKWPGDESDEEIELALKRLS